MICNKGKCSNPVCWHKKEHEECGSCEEFCLDKNDYKCKEYLKEKYAKSECQISIREKLL